MDDQIAQVLAVPVAGLGLLIGYAGVSKLFFIKRFAESLSYVPHLPLRWRSPLSIAVPLSEIAAGTGLLLGYTWGMVSVLVLLVSTSSIALLAHARNLQVPCLCFTPDASQTLSLGTAGRNACFACVALIPAAFDTSPVRPFVIVYGALALFFYLAVDRAIRNSSTLRRIGRLST